MKLGPNPKDLLGVKKVSSYSVVPATSMIYEAVAMQEGAAKYGPFNWRDHPVQAMVYIDALDRHIKAWVAGEELDPKSRTPHLGHAKACIGIIIDALETGNLIDNRPKNPATLRLLVQYDRTTQPQEGPRAAKSALRPTDRRRSSASSRRGTRTPHRKAARRR